MVVLSTGTKVGLLVYGTVVEAEFQQEGVQYAQPNSYILISKSGTTDPVSEMTAGQAMVIPVLQNVDSLFYIDTMDAHELHPNDNEDTTPGASTDAKITLWGTELDKATVVAKYNELVDGNLNANISDEDLIDYLNALSHEEEDLLKSELGVTGIIPLV